MPTYGLYLSTLVHEFIGIYVRKLSKILDDMFPYRLRIQNRENLIDDSDVLINQITTLNKFKIKEKIAKLTQEEYDLVIQALCKNFK